MPRGTQVRIPLQPFGTGERHESHQDCRGIVLQTHGDSCCPSLIFPGAQGGHDPGQPLSRVCSSPLTFKAHTLYTSQAMVLPLFWALWRHRGWSCLCWPESHWKADRHVRSS